MFDANRLLGDLIGGELTGRRYQKKKYRYRGAGGGLGGSLGRAALSPQGLTILGGLAIAAYEHLKSKQAPPAPAPSPAGPYGGSTAPPAPSSPPPFPGVPAASPQGAAATPPAGTPAVPAVPAGATATGAPPEGEARARLMIEAMILAARADGAIDPAERARILDAIDRQGAGPDARRFVEEQMDAPASLDALVARIQDPVVAAEAYAASLLAIDPDTAAERAHLALLAARLGLEPAVIRALEAQLADPDESTNAPHGA